MSIQKLKKTNLFVITIVKRDMVHNATDEDKVKVHICADTLGQAVAKAEINLAVDEIIIDADLHSEDCYH